MGHQFINQLRQTLENLEDQIKSVKKQLNQLEEQHKQENPAQQECDPLLLASLLFDHTLEGIMVTDEQEKILLVNQAFTSITGYKKEEVMGRTPRILSSGHHDTAFYKKLWKKLDQKKQWQGEIWNCRKNGELYAAWLNISLVEDPRIHKKYFVALFNDITHRKEAELLMHQQALHDNLTGLPNRLHFQEKFSQALMDTDQAKSSLAVCFLDLDGFKDVNDSLGHMIGDLLLQAISLRMKSCLRKKDVIARLGGDEFVILLPATASQQAEVVAEKLIRLVGQPYVIRHHTIQITTSIGICFYPQDGVTQEELIQKADQAMYEAKEKGKNQYQLSS